MPKPLNTGMCQYPDCAYWATCQTMAHPLTTSPDEIVRYIKLCDLHTDSTSINKARAKELESQREDARDVAKTDDPEA